MFRRRNPGMGLGMMLLAHQIFSVGVNNIPPVTLIAILGQSLLYTGMINPSWDKYDVCLSAEKILLRNNPYNFRCLILATLEHASDIHLYFNMASLLIKGKSLELRYGSKKFLIVLLVMTLSSSLMYVALAKAAAEFFQDYSYMRQCSIGFSGVLFALKVLTTHHNRDAFSYIHGIYVPAKYGVWVELLITHILVPNASFIGHLAGILVGLLYIFGPLKFIVNLIDNICGGSFHSSPSYTYTRSNTNYTRQYFQSSGRPTSNDNGQQQTSTDPSVPEMPNLEDLRQRRLSRYQ